MISAKKLITANLLNNAFVSKTDTNLQTISGPLYLLDSIRLGPNGDWMTVTSSSTTIGGALTVSVNTQYPLLITSGGSNIGPIGIKFLGHTTQEGYMYADHTDANSPGAAYSFHFGANTSSVSFVLDSPGTGGFYVGDKEVLHTGNIVAGGGITISDKTISHLDTSSQASVDNSNGTVIQDVTLDTYGHVTSLGSVNLDTRYLTLSGGNPSGTVNFQTNNGRIVLPVGTDKYAT